MLQYLEVVSCDVAAPRGLFHVMLQHLVVVASDVAVPRGLTSNVRCYWCSREHTGGRSSTVPITTVPITSLPTATTPITTVPIGTTPGL